MEQVEDDQYELKAQLLNFLTEDDAEMLIMDFMLEEEIVIDDDINGRREKKARVQNFIESVVDNYTDEEFRENFRLTRIAFGYVLELLRPHLSNKVGRKRISADKQLYIALYYLGTPDSYRSVISKFDVGKATAWICTFRVVFGLLHYQSTFIRWPTHEEALITANYIEETYGFPNVIGIIDGTHIEIAAPKGFRRSYINRKGYPSINFQLVCNEKLEFIDTFGGIAGSIHDMRMFKLSGLQRTFNDDHFPGDTHLIGDAAYDIQKRLMVPYKDNGHLSVEEDYFNHRLSSSRMLIERAIGLLKNRWRILLDIR